MRDKDYGAFGFQYIPCYGLSKYTYQFLFKYISCYGLSSHYPNTIPALYPSIFTKISLHKYTPFSFHFGYFILVPSLTNTNILAKSLF